MSKLKLCSKCQQCKSLEENFYLCSGKPRGDCKECTIKHNTRYANRRKIWQVRPIDENRRSYMREYYAKNKDKYAQYRSEFREKYPEYYKDYFRKKKEK